MTKSQISRMENGVLGSPETVDRLLEAMGYSVELKVVDRYENPDGEKQRVLDMLGNFKKYNAEKYGIESLQYITENFIKIRNIATESFFAPYKQVSWKSVFGASKTAYPPAI